MPSIEDLKKIDLGKVKLPEIKKEIEELLTDLNQDGEEALSLKDAKESINILYSLVQKHYPEAIEGNTPKKKKGVQKEEKLSPNKSLILKGIDELEAIAEESEKNSDTGDLEGILENTIAALDKCGDLKPKVKLQTAVLSALQPYFHVEKVFEKNQELRNGVVDERDQKLRKKIVISIDKLLVALDQAPVQEQIKGLANGTTRKARTRTKSKTQSQKTGVYTYRDGFQWMLISVDEAKKKYGEDNEVYGLNLSSETEALIEDLKDFKNHDTFGIEYEAESTSKETKTSKPKPMPEPDPPKTQGNQEALEQFKAMEPRLESCKRVLAEHRAKKRELEGPKPKKTRHTQLKDKMLSVAGLIPDKFKDDAAKLTETESILLTAYRKLIAVWEMDKVKAKPGEQAIKDKLEGYLEKGEKEDRKKLAKRWRDQLPELEQVMRKEWKESEELETVAKEMLENFRSSIKMFEEDPAEALNFLQKKYTNEQLETHLPKFIQVALGIEKSE